MNYSNRLWVERSDSVPGYIYLLRAKGYHGLFPGCYLQRCKIGLSRDPETRLQSLHASQPCCDYEIVKAVYVQDMATIEDALHARFKHCNIKLEKSREWHDFNPWQYAMVLWAFSRYESRRISFEDIPVRLVVAGLLVLLGTGMLIGQGMRSRSGSSGASPEAQPRVEVIPEQR